MNVTTHAMRCIRKAGGFDSFLLGKEKLLRDSERAMSLRSEALLVRSNKQREEALKLNKQKASSS